MIVNVGKLKNIEGLTTKLNFTVSPTDLKNHELFSKLNSELVFNGSVSNIERVIVIKGTIKCGLNMPCDRCEDKVAIPIECQFSERFTNLPVNEESEDSIDLNHFDGDMIDLTESMAKTIYLELPMKILCKEDCKGLCIKCGTNLNYNQCSCNVVNIDPRLAVLEDLKKELL